ncbi:hypothetical protein DMP15_04045 [Pseudonocardia sp. UM4_GMWB1]|uniref:hypothetical protein n=1 Tax=Pseudonocardia sp. UM4_GMWB1 TaxID=2212989 RepID=UPI000936C6E2
MAQLLIEGLREPVPVRGRRWVPPRRDELLRPNLVESADDVGLVVVLLVGLDRDVLVHRMASSRMSDDE